MPCGKLAPGQLRRRPMATMATAAFPSGGSRLLPAPWSGHHDAGTNSGSRRLSGECVIAAPVRTRCGARDRHRSGFPLGEIIGRRA